MTSSLKPIIGVSACLLGHSVRFNGGHKKQDWLVEKLSQWVEFDPVCPEVRMGLSVPRPAMRLEAGGAKNEVRLVSSPVIGSATQREQVDFTLQSKSTSHQILSENPKWDGYILKKNSPSCGLERVKVYSPSGIPFRQGAGLFASALQEKFPLLPVIEEGRLSEPRFREHFVERVFAYHRLRQISPTILSLQEFHRKYKLILMGHSPVHYQSLGRLIANSSGLEAGELLEKYKPSFMEALRISTSPQKRVNVLQHVMGYLKKLIDGQEKQKILEIFVDYRQGIVPFSVPVSLLHFLVQKYSITYLEEQFLFAPYPKSLGFYQAG